MIFLGLDVGTSGARVAAVSERGALLAGEKEPFRSVPVSPRKDGWFEQDTAHWWDTAAACLRGAVDALQQKGRSPEEIAALAVTSTSGTLVPMSEEGQAFAPAIMYSDARAEQEAQTCNREGADLTSKLGYSFSASFWLPKLLYLKSHQPDLYGRCARFGAATDFLNARVCGSPTATDYTNALKMGYDLLADRWPTFIGAELGVAEGLLPQVVAPGSPIGAVGSECSELTGLSRRTMVVAGMTDGCASQVATGALAPGQWASILGTTLVIKGVSERIVFDPQGAVYCHKHPMGYWLPGGASNVGADCIIRRFQDRDLNALAAEAAGLCPTDLVMYPLERTGERYPFRCPTATGFIEGEPRGPAELFAACMEGVAYVERLAYERLEQMGARLGDEVLVSGGGSESAPWLQIRADVLGKTLKRSEGVSAAKGAAILAASGTAYDNVVEAARAMAGAGESVAPRSRLQQAYCSRYERFVESLRCRGYLGET